MVFLIFLTQIPHPNAGDLVLREYSSVHHDEAASEVVRVGGDDGELRPLHYMYLYSIESRLIMRVVMQALRLHPVGNPLTTMTKVTSALILREFSRVHHETLNTKT